MTAPTKRLWSCWRALRTRIAPNGRLLLLFDYDGTLAPLVDDPAAARLPDADRPLLARLAAAPGAIVTVISGRALADVAARVALPGVIYAGNHGLEIAGPGVAFRHPDAEHIRPVLQRLAQRLRAGLGLLPGVLLEDKGLSLSLHHRRLRPADRPALQALVRALRQGPEAAAVEWKRGRQVWEVLPRAAWDKGRAAQYIAARTGATLAVAVGDDRTDEDMFRAIDGTGVTIRIGRSRTSRAAYHLARQSELSRLLSELLARLAGGG